MRHAAAGRSILDQSYETPVSATGESHGDPGESRAILHRRNELVSIPFLERGPSPEVLRAEQTVVQPEPQAVALAPRDFQRRDRSRILPDPRAAGDIVRRPRIPAAEKLEIVRHAVAIVIAIGTGSRKIVAGLPEVGKAVAIG